MSRATWPTNMTSGVGILARDVDARRGIGGARPAGDETDAGPAGDLADRLRHHGGAALLAADRDGEVGVVEGVEHRQIALARHAEDVAHAVDAQLIDQNLGGGAHIVLGAHGRLLGGPSLLFCGEAAGFRQAGALSKAEVGAC